MAPIKENIQRTLPPDYFYRVNYFPVLRVAQKQEQRPDRNLIQIPSCLGTNILIILIFIDHYINIFNIYINFFNIIAYIEPEYQRHREAVYLETAGIRT